MCPLEPARSRKASRNGRSSPLRAAGALEMAARARLGAAGALQIGWSSLSVGAAKAFEIVCSSSLGARSGCSGPFGFAGPIENNAQVCSVSLEHSNWQVEPAWFRWGVRSARHGCSSSDGGWRHIRKTVWKRCALVANRSKRLARLISTGCMDMKKGPHLIHIYYIYIYML